jgi:uncharacterized pyridoxamine 5'-phosphate oxidase family protein
MIILIIEVADKTYALNNKIKPCSHQITKNKEISVTIHLQTLKINQGLRQAQ